MKNITIKKLHEDSGDKEYWLAQTPAKRLEAVAILREQYFASRNETEPRLQRVLTVRRLHSGD